MASCVNKVNLMGFVGKRPKLTEAKVGKISRPVANFDLCTTLKINGKQRPTWHHIEVWGPVATACAQFICKGRSVQVFGYIENSIYKDSTGKEHSVTTIQASEVLFLAMPKGREGEEGEDE